MFSKHKWPTFSGIIVIIIMVISIFSFVYKVFYKLYMLKKLLFFIAFFTEDKITGAGFTDVTGKMVKVTGMDFKKLKSVKNNA